MEKSFNIAHALHCPKGYAHIRPNESCDCFADLLNEVCSDVKAESSLHTLQGETFANRTTTNDDARLDIEANSLFDWRFSRTFFDVKVCNPYMKSSPRSIPESYNYHDSIKELKYEQRIVEVYKATFSPLIFSCTWAGPSASKAIQRLASRISEKKEDSYLDVITYIRTKKISFALLRRFLLCLRGARSMRRCSVVEASKGNTREREAVALNVLYF